MRKYPYTAGNSVKMLAAPHGHTSSRASVKPQQLVPVWCVWAFTLIIWHLVLLTPGNPIHGKDILP